MVDESTNNQNKEVDESPGKDDSTVIRISYKSMFKVGFVIILLIVIIMLFKGFDISTATGNAVGVASQVGNVQAQEVQLAKIKVVGSQYVIEPNSFKVGVPVRIEADITQLPGCSKSIVISAFNVKKILTASDNIIEFTPNKAGTFNIACSMNMYKGTFTVLQSDGAKAAYVEKDSTSGASCGASGGGCGCGG